MSNCQTINTHFSAQKFSLIFAETRGFFGDERASNLTWEDFSSAFPLFCFLLTFNCDWNVVCLVYDWFGVSQQEKSQWMKYEWMTKTVGFTLCVIVINWVEMIRILWKCHVPFVNICGSKFFLYFKPCLVFKKTINTFLF